ncbi:MAG: universal stress protein [Anaerolineae bacterium]
MDILIATGGSPHSHLAIALGGEVASATGGAVTLLCVTETGSRDCQAVFRESAPLLAAFGEYRALVRHGQPAEEILRETEEDAYDLVIVGEKGHHTPLTRFLLGPTAERVATSAHLPVLVAKGDPEGPLPGPIRNVLLAVSLRRKEEDVERVLRRAAEIAKGTGATVTVLHVMSQMPIPPAGSPEDWEAPATELQAQATREGQLLQYVTRRLEADGIATQAAVRHGLVVDEILTESREGEYELLVVGGHEPGSWLQNLVLENVALQIVHRARIPVLTVHG